MKRPLAFLMGAVLAAALGFTVSSAFQVINVTDNGMLPTFEEGEHALVNRWAYRKSGPARGDIVVFPNRIYTLTGEGFLMIKRVAAVPGDSIMMAGESIYLNGKAVQEDHIFRKSLYESMEVQVGEGKVFVMGDNRMDSTDSRNETVGQVSKEDILGKVVFSW